RRRRAQRDDLPGPRPRRRARGRAERGRLAQGRPAPRHRLVLRQGPRPPPPDGRHPRRLRRDAERGPQGRRPGPPPLHRRAPPPPARRAAFDVVVVGGGTAGIAAASRLRALGLGTALVDDGLSLGGALAFHPSLAAAMIGRLPLLGVEIFPRSVAAGYYD